MKRTVSIVIPLLFFSFFLGDLRAEEITLPPGLPSTLTPEQIKTFLSKSKRDNFVLLNFDDADLRDVIDTVSSITGENFILSPGLEARITIHSAKRIPASEVLNVFESILEVNGMSLIRSGDFYKIVPTTTAKQKPLEVQKGRETEAIPPGDRPITQIIPVEYVPVKEVSSLLKPMLSPFGSIIPNPRNNLLIINDIASNIRRLLGVLKEIDVDAFQNTRMAFFRPKYSDVRTLSDELMEILNALNLAKEGVALVPIERINALMVFSSSPSLLRKVEGWVKRLDEEIRTGQNIFVYRVQNVKAENIAKVLETIYGDESKKITPRPSPTLQRRKGRRVVSSIAPTIPQESKVEIAVFEPTNSLVILASPGIYREMKEIIKKLDVYPKEVLIEVIIAEVTLTETDQFGIQWSVLHDLSIEGTEIQGLIQSRSTQTPSYTLPPTLGTGSADTSVTAGGLSYLLFKPERLVALLHALASRGKLNILSSPRLLVRDQEEASIEVGSEIPTATSTTADTTTATLTQNIEYKTVGIKLKIKPSINDEKTVVLEIEQEVSDTLANVTVGQEGFTYPAFSTRLTKTTIVVPDKQGIIIGGIMKERKEKSYQGIPILSSIPILGNLFRYSVETRDKTELLVLLTPHVVVNRSEADVLTTNFIKKLKEIRRYLEEYRDQSDIIKETFPPLEEDNKSEDSI